MAHRRLCKASAIFSILVLLFFSISVVSCDIQFTRGTAIQEVFEDELVNDDVSLHPTESSIATIRLVPDTSVPEKILGYEVVFYRTNSKTPYRTVEVDSSFEFELHDLPRASYRIVGRAITEDGVPVAVGEALIKVSSKGADAAIELKDVGHIMEHHYKVDATCTESGAIEHWHCTRCGLDFTDEKGENYIADTTIPAKGHSLVHVEAKAPKCTEKGNVEHWHCDGCGKDFEDKEGSVELEDVMTSALGHDWSTEWSRDEHGHWHRCTRCSATDNVAEHDMAVISHKDATEDEAGYDLRECSVCGYQRKDDIPPINHVWVEKERKASTCLEAGYVTYRCSDCGKEYTETIPKSSHSITYEEEKPATCTEAGNHEYWYCSTCGIYYKNGACSEKFDNKAKTIIEALGHNWPTTWEKDLNKHWHVCTRPGCSAVEEEEHTYVCKVESADFIASSATCESPAIYYCSCICGAKGTGTFKSTTYPAIGHKLEHVPANDATCGDSGNREYWHCTRTNCNKLFSDANGEKETSLEKVTIPATGKHVFVNEANPSGVYQSTSDGHFKQCLVCHKSIGDIEKHVWTKDNDTYYHWDACQVCHYSKKEGTKEFHNYVDGHCPVCGRYDEKPAQSGFDVGEKSSEPKGDVTYTRDENIWTFSFVDKTPDKEHPVMIEDLFWCLDGERQREFDGKATFELKTTKKQSYTVLCVYNNGKGYGSCEITVTGY